MMIHPLRSVPGPRTSGGNYGERHLGSNPVSNVVARPHSPLDVNGSIRFRGDQLHRLS